MTPLVTLTEADLRSRREQLLAEVGLSRTAFLERAATRTLTGEERDALEEMEEIDFLLGENASE